MTRHNKKYESSLFPNMQDTFTSSNQIANSSRKNKYQKVSHQIVKDNMQNTYDAQIRENNMEGIMKSVNSVGIRKSLDH